MGGRDALVGREAELAQLDAVVDALRSGTGGALRLDGPPGIGKSALLGAARPEDLTTLTVLGVETEAELPLAGLDALGLSLEDSADPAALLRSVGAQLRALSPVVLIVDDVQWLDPTSRTAIGYLARRAPVLGIAVIAAWSLRGPTPDAWPGVPVLALDELSRPAALRLATAGGVSEGVASALVDAVGGNPLALVEAPLSLTVGQRSGAELLPEPVPAGPRLSSAYAERMSALPISAQAALVLAAAGAPAAMVASALGPAEDAGLVRLGPGSTPAPAPMGARRAVAFAHPLVRSAVYHAATPSARRSAHEQIADASDEPERSWHLALAALAPDESLAARLESLAGDAQRRGAPGTAAAVYERAARLTPELEAASRRTVAAAAASLVAGAPDRARSLLDPLLPTAANAAARADMQLLRGMALNQAGRPAEAHRLLVAEADRVCESDGLRASALLTQACIALMGPGPVSELASVAARARALAGPDADVIPSVIEAEVLVSLGEHPAARALLARYEPMLETWDPTAPGHEVLAIAGLCRLWMGDHDEAEATLTRLVEANRAAGAVSSLALPLSVLATLWLRRGDLDRAAACALEASEIGDTGLSAGFIGSLSLAAIAMVAAHRGDAALVAATTDRMFAFADELSLTSSLACAEQALGHIHLARGDMEAAATHLTHALSLTRRHGTLDPQFLFTEADLVEALVWSGRVDEASEVLDGLASGARRTGGRWATAAVARCRGLLGDVDAYVEAACADVDMPFETARAQLALGERLRRDRRRSDARVLLSAARLTFAAAGAVLWEERAARELAAAGGSDGPSEDWAADLTARERDVCQLVASGHTNREVAARLFVSPRTVEHHLRIAYRKLDVRSRTELAALLADRHAA